MKKTIQIYDQHGPKDKEINYIPVRFILALMLIALETIAVIAIVILCAIYIPYFSLAMRFCAATPYFVSPKTG